ncbi:RraA family protein [Rhodobacterales bacterium HKCCE2091]|nr:RraA family protein [Rhodobacterales bacterium HKCCE2091]
MTRARGHRRRRPTRTEPDPLYSLKIREPERRVSPENVARYREIPSAVIGDCMLRLQAAGGAVRPMHAGSSVLAGPAYTVKARPGDNLFTHKAIDLASPGDVIVVDAGGKLDNAIVGEMMLTHAETRGIAGVIIFGAIRDHGHVSRHTFPVFASGVTLRGPFQTGPGHINVPIAIDGMVIHPGDLIIGDDDGVISIPYDDVDPLYEECAKRFAGENAQRGRVRDGSVDRKWIDDRLEQAPFPIDRA